MSGNQPGIQRRAPTQSAAQCFRQCDEQRHGDKRRKRDELKKRRGQKRGKRR